MTGPSSTPARLARATPWQARQGSRLLWNRADRLALTVLLGGWGIWLTYQAVTHTAALGTPPTVDPARVESVREKIDPNTASVASLRRLPLIGPVKAEAIVAYRESHLATTGPVFTSAKDLEKVPGIGPGIVRRVKRHIVLNPKPTRGGSPDPPRQHPPG